MASETVEIQGHIIDSLLLAKVLDIIVGSGADYLVHDFEIGKSAADTSTVRIDISADTDEALDALLEDIQQHGANRQATADVAVMAAEHDGVFPAGFYVTSNLPTSIRLDGIWHPVAVPEADCGIVITADGEVRTLPMHRVKAGDEIVVGNEGVRVDPITSKTRRGGFGSSATDASPEHSADALVKQVADRLRNNRDSGLKTLLVCGPAVIQTGAGDALATLVRSGWINVVFAGNGFATYDIEANVMGSPPLGDGDAGRTNHLRVVNEVRRFGSIAAAVEGGYIDGGVMFECVKQRVPFVLAGSVRDNGPLPDVITDSIEATDAMRYLAADIGVALMAASTLHAVAASNLPPARVETFVIDINPAAITKIAEQGDHQAKGIVTDASLFLRHLVEELGAS